MTMRLTLLPRPPLAIAAFVLLVATLPAQAQSVLVEKRRFDEQIQFWGALDESLLGGEDLDQDGYGDLLAYDAPFGPTSSAGGVGVYSGFSTERIAWLDGGVLDGFFGRHLCWVEDVDGDGRRDVAISRAGSWMFGMAAPQVEVRSSASGRLLATLDVPGHFGVVVGSLGPMIRSVSGMGDLDGDGAGDVLVTYFAPHYAVAFSGGTGQILREIRIPSSDACVAGRDLDLDGIADFVLSRWDPIAQAPRLEAYSTATGAVLWGRTLPSDRGLASDLGWMGDLDGDGRSEILVGMHWVGHWSRPQRPGMVAVLRGSDGLTHAAATGARLHFGQQVKVVGDVDGDAVTDFLVRAPYEERTYLYSGATMEVLASLGDSPVQGAAGDLDGDGRADFLVRHRDRLSVWGLTDFALRRNRGTYGYGTEFKFDVIGATPWSAVAAGTAMANGTSILQGSACAGILLPLATPQALAVVPTNGQGRARFTAPVSALPHGSRVVAVDLATCRLTNVLY